MNDIVRHEEIIENSNIDIIFLFVVSRKATFPENTPLLQTLSSLMEGTNLILALQFHSNVSHERLANEPRAANHLERNSTDPDLHEADPNVP